MTMKAVVALVLVVFLGPAWGRRKQVVQRGVQAGTRKDARNSTDTEMHVQKDIQTHAQKDAGTTIDTEMQSNCVQLCSVAYMNDEKTNSLENIHKGVDGRRNWIDHCVRQKMTTGVCITTIFAMPRGQSCASICPAKVQDKTSAMFGMHPDDCWSYCKNWVTSSNSGYSGGAGHPNTGYTGGSSYPAYPGGPGGPGYPNPGYPNPAYPGGPGYPGEEKRYAQDGQLYTYSQFVQWDPKDADRYWDKAKREKRYAQDGQPYTYSQFVQWYPEDAARYWDKAKRA